MKLTVAVQRTRNMIYHHTTIDDPVNGSNRDNNKSTRPENTSLQIATNDFFEDENEGDAVDSKAINNGTGNAVEAKVINGHAEQEAIDQMMLPYL
ncbi:hypothetical protein MAM1_0023c01949 [Mucor ambiguus]|uniref:Uncharacterized protein n=1 Tax=Mucor ambiguus TaxID=91626 RepID=A0A0C9LS27_9FUNG|nr:hypothetical protein MAM1_0023c01949 [Mucor ambiguus]